MPSAEVEIKLKEVLVGSKSTYTKLKNRVEGCRVCPTDSPEVRELKAYSKPDPEDERKLKHIKFQILSYLKSLEEDYPGICEAYRSLPEDYLCQYLDSPHSNK